MKCPARAVCRVYCLAGVADTVERGRRSGGKWRAVPSSGSGRAATYMGVRGRGPFYVRKEQQLRIGAGVWVREFNRRIQAACARAWCGRWLQVHVLCSASGWFLALPSVSRYASSRLACCI